MKSEKMSCWLPTIAEGALHNKILMYLQATMNIALHITIGQGLSCGCTSAATSGLWRVWAGKLHFKSHMDTSTFKQVLR